MAEHVPALTQHISHEPDYAKLYKEQTMGESARALTMTRSLGSVSQAQQSKRVPYLGLLQQTLPRETKIPAVRYELGGSDFRCPHSVSCFGYQVRVCLCACARMRARV